MITMAQPWYSFSLEKTFHKLESSDRGLSLGLAKERLKQYGANSFPEEKPQSRLRLFLEQFQSPLIYILLTASVVVFAMGENIDGSIILAVLLFNAIVGVIQEGKAQNTLLALKRFVETNATVLRDGKEYIIPDYEVVPGDILILQEGERIPADARVVISQSLRVDEASLTGESEPIYKSGEILERDDLPTAEQKNMVFRGTHIVAGHGRAVVVATGLSTVIGGIARQISSIDTEIPLKANIRYLSRAIIATVAIISTALFIVGVSMGHTTKEMFTIVVSLSVSIIPEGLPIVMTLVLATGVWRMSKRNALIKKLQAVEALGQTRVIAVDKTGTITKNELVIRKVWTADKLFEISGVGYEPKGRITSEGNVVNAVDYDELLHIGKAAALVATARLSYAKETKEWRISGDPTEAAMLVFSEKVGFNKEYLLQESPLLSEIPFDYKLKYHATVHQVDESPLLTVAGAPEVILSLCSYIRRGGKNYPLPKKEKEELEATFVRMSEEGLRVIAVAIRHEVPKQLKIGSINSLSFVGFFGMQDTLRLEVKEAMIRAKEAGIRVVMITGDHKITARAIAKEAGIYQERDTILTGDEIESMFDAELADKLADTTVFARVTPEHKMQIINAYKKRGEIVAMTGDGVNDAPSLVAADIGVSMGKIGTEVAKEASDIVLLDDNFGNIISAIEEGRSIYKIIKKVILYLFSTSIGEVLVISVALFLGYPLPILAAQIIWLNFVTDGFLDVALAMEPKEKGLLSGIFEHPKKYIIDSLMIQRMAVMAIPMMIGTLFLFSQYFAADIAKAWTISLTTLAVFQWFNAWNCRSESRSIFNMEWFSNKYLIGATLLVVMLQIAAVYTPIMQTILRTVPLTFSEWLMIIPVAASIIIVEEVRKYFSRRSFQFKNA
ncbi:MAG: HAD-IC family P-type ATPase [Patescibacteria group bacterium]|nr:HAD-IC family P-type ATPase [Patescibacteria group bacterium]